MGFLMLAILICLLILYNATLLFLPNVELEGFLNYNLLLYIESSLMIQNCIFLINTVVAVLRFFLV